MKINNFFIHKYFKYFILILTSIWIGFIIADFGVKLILRLSQVPTLWERLIVMLTYAIVAIISIIIVSHKVGYKDCDFNIKKTLLGLLIVFSIHLLLNLIFSYAIYVSGGSYYLAQVSFAGGGEIVNYKDVPKYYYLISVLVLDIIYIPFFIIGENRGIKKRIKDREQLTKSKKEE